jgi:hypothetical protein
MDTDKVDQPRRVITGNGYGDVRDDGIAGISIGVVGP